MRLINAAGRQLAGALDGAVVQHVITPPAHRRGKAESLSHVPRMEGLAMIARFYEEAMALSPDTDAFTRLPAVVPREKHVRAEDGFEVVDLRWDSGFEALWSDEEALRRLDGMDIEPDAKLRLIASAEHAPTRGYDQVPENRAMHVRWFRHNEGPRPCAILIHGFMSGNFRIEEAVWPVRTFLEGGMDVLLTTLPLHGRRIDPKRRMVPPRFPDSDPRLAVEGFRHMAHDHLSLIDYLLDGRATSVGVAGMSLGGYSAALLSTLEPRLRFGIFDIPLSCIADFARGSGRMVGTDEQQELQTEALRKAYSIISPLSRPSLLPDGKSLVIAGEADLVTGIGQARKLADHFDAQTSTFPGGHLIQLGKSTAFEPAWQMLRDAGVYDR